MGQCITSISFVCNLFFFRRAGHETRARGHWNLCCQDGRKQYKTFRENDSDRNVPNRLPTRGGLVLTLQRNIIFIIFDIFNIFNIT